VCTSARSLRGQLFGLGVALFIALASAPCRADADRAYPNHPVTLVVGAPPGGESDRMARVLAERLRVGFGQSVIVSNHGGAGGVVAAQLVAKAKPDGYTMLLSSMASWLAAISNPGMADPANELVPIALASTQDLVLVINPSLPAKSFSEFIAYTTAHPGLVSYASSGVGTASHIAGELLKEQAGIDIVHVPYQGAAQIRRDLLAGEVLSAFAPPVLSLPLINTGRLHALASTGSTRLDVMPELPTIAEQGFAGYSVTNWHAIAAPIGTPAEIVNLWNRALRQILKDPQIATQFAAFGLQPSAMTISETNAFIASERNRWQTLLATRARGSNTPR